MHDTWAVGQTIDNLYEIFGVSSGGMGSVYFVNHLKWKIPLAVKTPLPSLVSSPTAYSRYIKEAETWINIGMHPNIVSCFYVREIGGIPRIFVEYVGGGTLKDLIDNKRLGDLGYVLDLAIQIAMAMEYVHDLGIIHRDIKPANCMFTSDGEVKLTDFGIAKFGDDVPFTDDHLISLSSQEGLTMTGVGFGTPEYMAPEQFLDAKHIGKEADIYAFGVMLYEMVCGTRPFVMPGGMHSQARDYFYRNAHNYEFPDFANSGLTHAPDSLSLLLAKCLEKNPTKRLPSFKDVCNLLANCLKEFGKFYTLVKPEPLKLRADSLNNKALSFLDLKKPDDAYDCFIEALSIDCNHLASIFNKCYLDWQHYGDDPYREVLAMIRSHEIDLCNNDQYWYCRAIFELNIGLYELAYKSFEKIEETESYCIEKIAAIHTEPNIVYEYSSSINCAKMQPNRGIVISGFDDGTIDIFDLAKNEHIHTFSADNVPVIEIQILQNDYFASGDKYGNISIWNLDSFTLSKNVNTNCIKLRKFHIDLSCARLVTLDFDGYVSLYDLDTNGLVNRYSIGILGDICLSKNHYCFTTNKDLVVCNILDGDAVNFIDLSEISKNSIPYKLSAHNHEHVLLAGNGVYLVNIITGGIEEEISRVTTSCICNDMTYSAYGSPDRLLRIYSHEKKMCTKVINVIPGRNVISETHDDDEWFFCDIKNIDISTRLKTIIYTVGDNILRFHNIDGFSNIYEPVLSKPCSYKSLIAEQSAYIELLKQASQMLSSGLYTDAHNVAQSARHMKNYYNDVCVLDLIHNCGLLGGYKIGIDVCSMCATIHTLSGPVTSLALTSDGNFLLPGNNDANLNIYNVPSGEMCGGHQDRSFVSNKKYYKFVALSHDDRHVATLGEEEWLKNWSFKEIKIIQQVDSVRLVKGKLASIKFVSDGSLAIYCDSKLYFYKIDERSCDVHENIKGNVLISNDGRFVLVEDDNHKISVYDVTKEKFISELGGDQYWLNTAVAIQGNVFLLAAGWDFEIIMWDLKTGLEVRKFLGHTEFVNCIIVSSDDRYLFSCSSDFSIRLWDIATGECLRVFEAHTDAVTCLVLTPDDRYLISGSDDGTIKIWSLNWKWDLS